MPIAQAGLYVIHFAENHFYGGRSVNVSQRWQRHKWMLQKGCHPNTYMQAVFDKHGSQFHPEILVFEQDPVVLVQIEQNWLDQFFGQPGCLNLSASAQYNPEYQQTCQTLSERATTRFRDPAEREKMAAPQRGVPKTEAAKVEMSRVWKDTHHWSDELKLRWSAQRKGKPRSEQAKKSISAGLQGHAVSMETRAKISAANKAYQERKQAEKQKEA